MGRPSSLASASSSTLPPSLSAKLADLFRTSLKSCAADFASANPYPYFDHHHRSLQHAHPNLANPDAWNFDALLAGLHAQSDSSPSRIHFDRWVRSIILASATLGSSGSGTPSRPSTSRPPLPTESPDSLLQPVFQADSHHRSGSSRWEPADRRALDRPLPASHAPAHVHAHDWLSSHSLLRARHEGLPRLWGRESPVWNWNNVGDSARALPRARPANAPPAMLAPPTDDPAGAARLNLTLPSFSSILSSSLPPPLSPAPAPAAPQPLSELENDMRELQDVTLLRIVREGILRELSHPGSLSDDPPPPAANSDELQAADQQADFSEYITTSMPFYELRRIRNQIAQRADGVPSNASPISPSGADERGGMSMPGRQRTDGTTDMLQSEADAAERPFEPAPELASLAGADTANPSAEPASAVASTSLPDVLTPAGARNRTADFASHSALVRSNQRRAFAASRLPSGPEIEDGPQENGDCGRRRRRPCCASSSRGSSEADLLTSPVPTTADLAESYARSTNAHGALPAFYMADPSRPIDILEVLIPVDTDPMERRKMIRHATRDGGNVVRWSDAAQKAMFEAAEDGLVGEEIGLIKISCVCLPDREQREPSWGEGIAQAEGAAESARRARAAFEMGFRRVNSLAASYRPYPRSESS